MDPKLILDLPMGSNDAGVSTVREYRRVDDLIIAAIKALGETN